MSFEFFSQTTPPSATKSAVRQGGEVLPANGSHGALHDECSAVSRPQLPPADDGQNDELQCSADSEGRRRLHSTSSSSLTVRRTRLSTVGDRAFPVAAARTWSASTRHDRILYVCFTRTLENFPLQAFLSLN